MTRWLGTVGVQGLGALATLAVGLLIAKLQGPQAQGQYGLVRSTADLLLALGLFGLPQGIVHLLNHLRVAPSRVERWMRRYLALLSVLTAAVLIGSSLLGGDPLRPAGPGAGLALAIGVFGWVVHGLQRVFVLCRGSTPRFSWVSVAPALTLFSAVALLAWTGSRRYDYAVAFSGLASAGWGALALRALRRVDGWRPPPDAAVSFSSRSTSGDGTAASAIAAEAGQPTASLPPWPLPGPLQPRWTALLHPSLHALMQTAALALQPWLALQLLLREAPAGSQEIGWFVFAAHVAQAFALPAGFVAPLVFARASRAAGLRVRTATGDTPPAVPPPATANGPIHTVGWITVAASLAAAAALPFAVPALFGADYAGAGAACVAMALSGPALVVGRLHTALLLGEGHFAAVTVLFALRAALVPVCALALWRWTALGPAAGAAAGWALAETVVALAQAALRSRRGRQSAATR